MGLFNMFNKNFKVKNENINDNNFEYQKEEQEIIDYEHPIYVFNSSEYGNIEFYNTEDDNIEIRCNQFNNKVFDKVLLLVDRKKFKNEEEKKLAIRILEKTISMKEMVLDKIYDYTLEICNNWQEKDASGNNITKEYIKSHLSKISVEIWPKYSYLRQGKLMYDDNISFHSELYDEDGEVLLGGHEICYIVLGNEMSGKLN